MTMIPPKVIAPPHVIEACASAYKEEFREFVTPHQIDCILRAAGCLNVDEYQKLAMRTANRACSDITNAALGMCGEAGEFADELKKHLYQGRDRNDEKLKKELGDVLWYVALACDALGCTMSEVAEANVAKLRARYPEGYSDERSLNRSAE